MLDIRPGRARLLPVRAVDRLINVLSLAIRAVRVTDEGKVTLEKFINIMYLTLIVLSRGGCFFLHATQLCPCSHNDKTTLIKQIFLFDTALIMTNT